MGFLFFFQNISLNSTVKERQRSDVLSEDHQPLEAPVRVLQQPETDFFFWCPVKNYSRQQQVYTSGQGAPSHLPGSAKAGEALCLNSTRGIHITSQFNASRLAWIETLESSNSQFTFQLSDFLANPRKSELKTHHCCGSMRNVLL